MAGTNTVRVTFNDESIEDLWGINPIALNEPELIRFFTALGRLHAVGMVGEDMGLDGLEGLGIDIEPGGPAPGEEPQEEQYDDSDEETE